MNVRLVHIGLAVAAVAILNSLIALSLFIVEWSNRTRLERQSDEIAELRTHARTAMAEVKRLDGELKLAANNNAAIQRVRNANRELLVLLHDAYSRQLPNHEVIKRINAIKAIENN